MTGVEGCTVFAHAARRARKIAGQEVKMQGCRDTRIQGCKMDTGNRRRLVSLHLSPLSSSHCSICNGPFISFSHFFILSFQTKLNGDATLCCASGSIDSRIMVCGGTANICQHFYDSAPSGCYGTMSYITRAVALTLDTLPKTEVDCNIS